MRVHLIAGNTVQNTIEIDSVAKAQEYFPTYVCIEATTGSQGWMWDGETLTEPPPVMPTLPEYVAAVQSMLDAKARERNYDHILSACTYATSTNETFAADGQACVAWRDAVWASCYTLLAQVQENQIPQPTIAELLAMLPALTWPA